MPRPARCRTLCGRNRRYYLVLLTFGCALCMLLWRTTLIENGVELEAVVDRDSDFPVKILNKITSSIQPNSTHGLRRQHVIDECRKVKAQSWNPDYLTMPDFANSPIISTKRNLLYCPVGKVASSFFTRYVLYIDDPGLNSPFDIRIENASRGRCESLKTLKSRAQQREFVQTSTKVVFGRNPYSRIFSAYIDKLFSPNPYYWKYWGERAKVNGVRKTTPCASDVTFQQFLKLVLKTLHKSDVHLIQVYTECKMCDVIYDVIGQLETTEADLDFLSSLLNISSAFQHDDNYASASKMDTVYDSVNSAFQWKKDIARCINLDQMGLRIWRKLQIRGVFDSSISYPFHPGDIEAMPAERYIAACKSAMQASTDKAQLKKQKNQALLETYSSVDEWAVAEIAKAYKDDFRLFGYDPKPVKLFESRKQISNTGALNWRTDWNV